MIWIDEVLFVDRALLRQLTPEARKKLDSLESLVADKLWIGRNSEVSNILFVAGIFKGSLSGRGTEFWFLLGEGFKIYPIQHLKFCLELTKTAKKLYPTSVAHIAEKDTVANKFAVFCGFTKTSRKFLRKETLHLTYRIN